MSIISNLFRRQRNRVSGGAIGNIDGVPFSALDLNSVTQLSNRVNAFYGLKESIINKVALDVASSSFIHIQRTRHDDRADDVTELHDSDITYVLSSSTNPVEVPVVFWSRVVRTMLTSNFALVVPTYDRTNKLTELTLVECDIDDSHTDYTYLYYTPTDTTASDYGSEKRVRLSDVLLFVNPRPQSAMALRSLDNLIDNAYNSVANSISNPKLKAFLTYPTMVRDESQVDKTNNTLKKMQESLADNDLGLTYLPKGVEVKEVSNEFGRANADDLATAKEQLFATLGVNASIFSNRYTEQDWRAYFNSFIYKYMQVIQQELNRKLLTRTAVARGERILVSQDEFATASLKDRGYYIQVIASTGVAGESELRDKIGFYGPVPEYETRVATNANANASASSSIPVSDSDDTNDGE